MVRSISSGVAPDDLINLPRYTAYARLLLDEAARRSGGSIAPPCSPSSKARVERLDPLSWEILTMLVELSDGHCRECGGQLEIDEVDDATMTVLCLDCGDSYPVETDAFNDGGVRYWPQMMVEQEVGK